jgi:hypothetical protein
MNTDGSILLELGDKQMIGNLNITDPDRRKQLYKVRAIHVQAYWPGQEETTHVL